MLGHHQGAKVLISEVDVPFAGAELGGMWVPVSFDAIATVRLLGQFTLAGHNIRTLLTAP